VVALVLDGCTAFAQTAGNEWIGLRVERLLVPFSHDDLLLQVLEAVGRVLVGFLLDLALAARDTRECQNKPTHGGVIWWRTGVGAGRCCISRALFWRPSWLDVGVVGSRIGVVLQRTRRRCERK
jgi:hypothetical protein